MSKQTIKTGDTTFKITETKTQTNETLHNLDYLVAEKEAAEKRIQEIDALIAEGRSKGVKTRKEIEEEKNPKK
jgi:hypothetical protein